MWNNQYCDKHTHSQLAALSLVSCCFPLGQLFRLASPLLCVFTLCKTNSYNTMFLFLYNTCILVDGKAALQQNYNLLMLPETEVQIRGPVYENVAQRILQ